MRGRVVGGESERKGGRKKRVGGRGRERTCNRAHQTGASAVYNLILNVTHYHFTGFLSVTQTNPGTMMGGLHRAAKARRQTHWGPSWRLASTEVVCKTCSAAGSCLCPKSCGSWLNLSSSAFLSIVRAA